MVSVDRIRGLSGSLPVKPPVKAATTANITLSGEQTIDGVAVVSGDRVLVKDQTDGTLNGIYDVDTGTWTRSLDFDGNGDFVEGTLVTVNSGTSNTNTMWRLTTASPEIGDALSFSAFNDVGLAGDLADSSDAAKGDALIAVKASGTGAAATTLHTWISRQPVNLLDYGADPTGVTDCTTAITNAIAAAKAGSGVVFVPKGKYLIDCSIGGNIAVSYVTLLGCGAIEVTTPYDDNGSVFLIQGTTNSPFVVTRSATFDGLAFFYPDQIDQTPLITYPALFKTNDTVLGNSTWRNCTIVNAYVGWRLSGTGRGGDIRIDGCRVFCIDKVFHFTTGFAEVLILTNNLFTIGMYEDVALAGGAQYIKAHYGQSGEFMRLDLSDVGGYASFDGLTMSNNLIFGCQYGIRVMAGALSVSVIGGCKFDGVAIPFSLEGTAVLNSTTIQNNLFYSYEYGNSGSTDNEYAIQIASGGSISNLHITGNHFAYARGGHINLNAAATDDILITGNRFSNWGQTATGSGVRYEAIALSDADSSASITGNIFRPYLLDGPLHLRSAIVITNMVNVLIEGNQFIDCYESVRITLAQKGLVANNVAENTQHPSQSIVSETHSGTAQAGAAGTITLDTGASAVDDVYNDLVITITSGTGVGQVRAISDYDGSTKVATLARNWSTNPDNTSVFIIAVDPTRVVCIDNVLDKPRAIDTYPIGRVSVVQQSAFAVSHTGDTNETLLTTVTIPGGAIGAHGRLRITSLWSYPNSANVKTLRQRFGASGTGLAGTLLMGLAPTTTLTYHDEGREVATRGSYRSLVGRATGGNDGSTNASPFVTGVTDTNADFEIVFTAQLASAAETITLENYVVEVIPAWT